VFAETHTLKVGVQQGIGGVTKLAGNLHIAYSILNYGRLNILFDFLGTKQQSLPHMKQSSDLRSYL
jgi:hypothetical protein